MNASGEILDIGYIAAFEDGRRDLIGHFSLNEQSAPNFAIFKQILKQQPPAREASYIWVNVKSTAAGQSPDVAIIEFNGAEIAQFLNRIIRPGIVRH